MRRYLECLFKEAQEMVAREAGCLCKCVKWYLFAVLLVNKIFRKYEPREYFMT